MSNQATETLELTERETDMIRDCYNYGGSGLPGHTLFILIAKLARLHDQELQNRLALEGAATQREARLARALNDLGTAHDTTVQLRATIERQRVELEALRLAIGGGAASVIIERAEQEYDLRTHGD